MERDKPLIVAGVVRIPPENLAALRPHIQTYVAACRAEPGCSEFAFAQDVADPSILRVFEIWETAEALEKHSRTHHVAVWREAAANLGMTGRDLVAYRIDGSSPT